MNSSLDKSSKFQPLLNAQSIIYAGITWAVLALLFYLLFSTPIPGEERPFWYSISTYIFEQVPFLVAAILCLRNWRSPQIASGRRVWLGIGLGMLSYFIGNLVFGWWELHWGLDPDVSPADLFFIGFYLCLAWGMILAVVGRRLNLELWQWGIVGGIAAGAITLAIWLSFSSPAQAQPVSASPLAPTLQKVSSPGLIAASPRQSPSVRQLQQAKPTPRVKPATATPSKTPAAAATTPENSSSAPQWVLSLQQTLQPLGNPLGLFYIIFDVLLLIIATILLLGFWGGRLAQSWRMLAAATFCFYIADMWFNYATNYISDYQSGFLLEVFWVFSGVLFAIGAVLEYENSSRSRRGGRKRA